MGKANISRKQFVLAIAKNSRAIKCLEKKYLKEEQKNIGMPDRERLENRPVLQDDFDNMIDALKNFADDLETPWADDQFQIETTKLMTDIIDEVFKSKDSHALKRMMGSLGKALNKGE